MLDIQLHSGWGDATYHTGQLTIEHCRFKVRISEYPAALVDKFAVGPVYAATTAFTD